MKLPHPSAAGPRIQALKLELNAVEHCNLSCRSCSHLSPIQPRHSVDPDDVHRDLALLSRHYHARWLRIVGGEPLLHRRLDLVLDAIRRSEVVDRVMLVTNGVLLPRMPETVWGLLDRIDVSQYPGKTLDDRSKRRCVELAGQHNVAIHFDATSSFRVAYSEQGASSAQLVEDIYRSCEIVHVMRCHTVARGRFYRCPQSYFLSRSIPDLYASREGIPISDSPDFGASLRALLENDRPLDACRHCLGTAGKRFAHGQIKRADFRMPQKLPTELLVEPKYLRRRAVMARRVVGAARNRVGRDAR